MSFKEATDITIDIAAKRLADIDLSERCSILGLPLPQDGRVRMRAFGRDVELTARDWSVWEADHGVASSVGKQVHPVERILILKYLLGDQPLEKGGEPAAFREFSGGRFYEGPFRARSTGILTKVFGNNVERLRSGLGRFDWTPVLLGDVGARIHAVGTIFLTLIYRMGDDEFPPAADILFEPCALKAYDAETAAVLAGWVCKRVVV